MARQYQLQLQYHFHTESPSHLPKWILCEFCYFFLSAYRSLKLYVCVCLTVLFPTQWRHQPCLFHSPLHPHTVQCLSYNRHTRNVFRVDAKNCWLRLVGSPDVQTQAHLGLSLGLYLLSKKSKPLGTHNFIRSKITLVLTQSLLILSLLTVLTSLMFLFPNQQSPCLVTEGGKEEELGKKLGMEGGKLYTFMPALVFCFYTILFIQYFCAGSLLLHVGFLYLWRWGFSLQSFSHCRACALGRTGFSSCGTRALDCMGFGSWNTWA